MQNVNDVNDISETITREGKKTLLYYTNNFSNTRYIVDKKNNYFLCEIDEIVYFTNSYEIYNLFYPRVFPRHIPIDIGRCLCKAEANRESFLKGMEQEKKRYDDGYKYVSERVKIRGKLWKKGKWIKEVF